MSASAAKATGTNVHTFVGARVQELRGKMPLGDFAAKVGMHHVKLSKLEGGEPSCLARLELLAAKTGKEVSWFFPNETIPAEYPEH